MKRPWRILIEVGDTQKTLGASEQTESTISPSRKDAAWEKILDARRKLVDAIAAGPSGNAGVVSSWLGGALSIFAELTAQDPTALEAVLKAEIPSRSIPSNSYGPDELKIVERPQRPRPPGAQRVVSAEELAAENSSQDRDSGPQQPEVV